MMLENIGYGLRLIRMLQFDKKRNIGAIRVDIAATSACNYRCYFCNAHSYLRSQQVKPLYLTKYILSEILKSLARLGTRNILFAGNGEPLLHTYLPELIVQSQGFKIEVLTNGSNLHKIDEDTFNHLSRLTISLNSGNGKSHKLIHGYSGENQFPEICSQINRLLNYKSANLKLRLNYVETSDNSDEVDDFKKLADYWKVSYAIRPVSVDFNELEGKGIGLKGKSGLYPCYNGFIQPYIASNGDFLVCCDGAEKPLGNIYQKNLKDIWRSNSARELIMKAVPMRVPLFKGCVGCANAQLQSKTFDRYYSKLFRR